MLSYCLKCKKNTENIKPVVSKTSNGKTMVSSQSVLYVVVKNQNLLKDKKQKGY